MKKLLTLSLLLYFSEFANAQFLKERANNSRIQLELGNGIAPREYNATRIQAFSSAGITAIHKMYNNFHLKATYQQTLGPQYMYEAKNYNTDYRIWHRSVNSFIDLGAIYSYEHKRCEIYAGIGASTAFAVEERKVGNYDPNDWVCEIFTEPVKTHYYGMVWEAGYNYHAKNNRLNFGPSISGRHYPNQFSQYSIKLNIGYNFMLL